MDAPRPISYTAVTVGTPVLSASDTRFGTVEHVLQIPSLDLFDGIVVKAHHGLRFVDRDQIAELTTAYVKCALSDEEVAALPPPSGHESLHVEADYGEGRSLGARFARMFGRTRWEELD